MSSQLSLSFELIVLMDWLLKHGKPKLRALVKEAVDKKLLDSLATMSEHDYMKVADQLHTVVADFILLLEDILVEELEGVALNISSRGKMPNALRHIDNRNIEVKKVWLSVQLAKRKFIKKSRESGDKKMMAEQGGVDEQEFKQELFRQLLKNWEPTKKEPVN